MAMITTSTILAGNFITCCWLRHHAQYGQVRGRSRQPTMETPAAYSGFTMLAKAAPTTNRNAGKRNATQKGRFRPRLTRGGFASASSGRPHSGQVEPGASDGAAGWPWHRRQCLVGSLMASMDQADAAHPNERDLKTGDRDRQPEGEEDAEEGTARP